MKPIVGALVVCLAQGAWSQSLCTSDGQTTPVMLVERFISADCETCWSEQPSIQSERLALTIDWIVPSTRGDDAALSAGATRDAQMRLDNLQLASPATSTLARTKVLRSRTHSLRVAHGLPVGLYLGSIVELSTSLKVSSQTPLSAWLLLVESVPAGSDGTPVARNLVRNVLVLPSVKADLQAGRGHYLFRELRPMNIPSNARPERLRLVGWVQDAHGRVLSVAQSVCAASGAQPRT
jgi:hypothetical protein